MRASLARHLALAPRVGIVVARRRLRGGVRAFAAPAPADASRVTGGGAPWDASKITWDMRVLYDGDCPLCLREIQMLQWFDRRIERISHRMRDAATRLLYAPEA